MSHFTNSPLSQLKVAWIGGRFFLDAFRNHVGELAHIFVGKQPRNWDWIVERCGFVPDILIYADRSQPPMLLGLESYPCLTVFLSVDSHIHGWYPIYAQAFDLCTVSLKDHIDEYRGKRLPDDRVLWLPAFAKDEDRPLELQKKWGLLFVGNVKEDIFPVRARMLRELQKKIPNMHVTQGDYRELFSQARLVLNIAERGDMNYRLFEALGCGACLVTPEIGHGQSELFTDGEDIFTYEQSDLDGLVKLVAELTANGDRCKQVAKSGFNKVDRLHRASHRAAAFAEWIAGYNRETLVQNRLDNSKAILDGSLKLLYLHFAETIEHEGLRSAYLQALKGS
ncbi:glycosyltransferase [Desulfovibrio sp. JC010]|uniref:glycosyltransferase family protein n=1 Tax=Desulfovibrio sp. JC010 TaxID=2593641 RepID=UPI0013D37237|nr:glycosyltransferase [Desulfovibrio sp. JC010]NDV27474.1 glycosyltransferase family 1 protein [Desulfovibrio sp. JC010]